MSTDPPSLDPFDAETWARLGPIIDAALDADGVERDAVLDRLCGKDITLRRAADTVLEAAATESALLAHPASGIAGDLLSGPASGDARRAAPTNATSAGQMDSVIAGYQLERLVGYGGMGEVYRAHDPTLERTVALKVLPERLRLSDDAKRRLINEARAASALDHPHIQTIFDAGETDDGRVYVAMAFYEGATLGERLSSEGDPLPVAEALDIARQVARGLAEAHRHGIVHRDVKPSNLILMDNGTVKILDFGVARLPGHTITSDGPTLGTIAYMSPEQTRGAAVDRRADLWALGVVLYEMLTGRRPFEGQGDQSIIYAIRNDDPPPVEVLRPEVPPDLAATVRCCLRKDPEERYESAEALLDALATADGAARHAPSRRVAWSQRSRRLATGFAVAAVVTLAALFVSDRMGPGSGSVHPATATMAILPLVPVTPDSALRRLGRQFTVTLSVNLDGAGNIRTVDALTVLANVADNGGPITVEQGADLARRFGATSFLFGSLLDVGDAVRIDAALYDTESVEVLARLTVTGPERDIAALTDSVTLDIIRNVSRLGEVSAPSLASVTTRSIPALRAYLDGEVALAGGRFVEAVSAFEEAFTADSTFWFALWRSFYPRVYEGSSIGVDRYAALYEHRNALPTPDRLWIESYEADKLTERLELLREITRRFPTYWPVWYEYANSLIHRGLFTGASYDDARRAFERVIELNPDFTSAWEHLFWIVYAQHDTARAAQALAKMEQAAHEGAVRLSRSILPTYQALFVGLTGTDSTIEEQLRRKVATILDYQGPLPTAYFSIDLLIFGDARNQARVNWKVLQAGPQVDPDLAADMKLGLGLAFATRGAWDSAFVALESRRHGSAGSWGALVGYQLAVTGAWLDEVPPERAAEFRPSPGELARFSERDAPAPEEIAAELRWLDGILAFARVDAAGLEAARAGLAGRPEPHAAILERSLAAFEVALAGDSAAAGRALAELEEDSGEQGRYDSHGRPHPFLASVNRLAAGRWLAAAGDTLRALRLLSWHQAVVGERHRMMGPAGIVVSPHALLLRARLEHARGETARAAIHYTTFLRRYDLPSDRRHSWIREAEQRN